MRTQKILSNHDEPMQLDQFFYRGVVNFLEGDGKERKRKQKIETGEARSFVKAEERVERLD